MLLCALLVIIGIYCCIVIIAKSIVNYCKWTVIDRAAIGYPGNLLPRYFLLSNTIRVSKINI